MAVAKLGKLLPLDTVEALVRQLEAHRNEARSGEIVVKFHCDRYGQCGGGRMQPAEIVTQEQPQQQPGPRPAAKRSPSKLPLTSPPH